jgi:hypothetical protein
MITVVSPTMWRYPPFLDFVKYIVKLDIIKEVIIINNAPDKTPEHEVLNHPKIKMHSFGKNIFVNPAWNYGVNVSESDTVCILNDDLHFDLRLFYKVEEFMRSDIGAIGLNSGIAEWGQTPVTDGMIDFEAFKGQNCQGFGELMFVRKSVWCNIPNGLDVGFGDNFIFDYHHFRGLPNYFISNMFYFHKGNQTMFSFTSEENQIRYDRELAVYNQVKAKLYDRSFYLTNSIG